ncbi:MAG: two-component sensor histidine kinase, partial [Rhodocyclaceae bacterium]|nr:two-component sensor histidine kinase [Rhodocyclaceae bacterium]
QSETLAAVGEMGLAVAHGIRNPLAAIRSSAELNLETSDPQSRESAQDIIAEVDRVESWVRELLSYARPVTGQAHSVDLGTLLGECLAEFERETARRDIVIARHIPGDLPPVRFDPLLLGQVAGNLVANACEAIGHAGCITVRAEAADRSVRLAVEDDGPGLAPEELARVFTPFYTTKARGMGLGLPLTKRILERFGGSITVDSAPGRGTRVELMLPTAA